jgi:hypothetical protein
VSDLRGKFGVSFVLGCRREEQSNGARKKLWRVRKVNSWDRLITSAPFLHQWVMSRRLTVKDEN